MKYCGAPRVAQGNFGRDIDWVMVQEHPWSTPKLRKKKKAATTTQ